jgi:hypothetical protein
LTRSLQLLNGQRQWLTAELEDHKLGQLITCSARHQALDRI